MDTYQVSGTKHPNCPVLKNWDGLRSLPEGFSLFQAWVKDVKAMKSTVFPANIRSPPSDVDVCSLWPSVSVIQLQTRWTGSKPVCCSTNTGEASESQQSCCRPGTMVSSPADPVCSRLFVPVTFCLPVTSTYLHHWEIKKRKEIKITWLSPILTYSTTVTFSF